MNCEHRYGDGRSAFQGDCTGVTCRICGEKLTTAEFIAISSNAYAHAASETLETSNEPKKEKTPQNGSKGGRKKGAE